MASALTSNPNMQIGLSYEHLTRAFLSGRTQALSTRFHKLCVLESLMYTYERSIVVALYSDLRLHPEYTLIVSIATVPHDITQFRRHINSLLKPRRMGRLLGFLSPIDVESVPKGVVLMFGPSNYPVSLTLRPLVSAVTTANCVAVKPLAYASASEWIPLDIIRKVDPIDGTVAVIAGDVDVARHLMTKKWDHFLFTGSTAVGKQMLRIAADTFTPVTLELSDKKPVVVASDADLTHDAHAVVKGRYMNSGQLRLPPVCIVQSNNFIVCNCFIVSISWLLTNENVSVFISTGLLACRRLYLRAVCIRLYQHSTRAVWSRLRTVRRLQPHVCTHLFASDELLRHQ